MADPILLLRRELGHRLAKLGQQEHRIVTEPEGSSRLIDDLTWTLAAVQLHRLRQPALSLSKGPRDPYDAAEPGLPLIERCLSQPAEQILDPLGVGRFVAGVPRRADPGLAAQGIHLEPRVVGQHRQPAEPAVGLGLQRRILFKG